MRRPGYFLRETLQGFRRNGLVVLAAVSTVFIALFLMGGALILQREVNLIVNATEANIQVAVYLDSSISPAQQTNIQQILESMPQVKQPVKFETQAEACANFHQLFKGTNLTQGVPCSALPASYRVNLVDPAEFAVVNARLHAEPGVQRIVDNSQLFHRIVDLTRVSRVGFTVIALIMLISATGLIANTVRVAVFARRKEIEIMRLVGATNWTIRIPFLLEGLIEGLVGAAVAVGGLFIMKTAFVGQLRGVISFLPLVNTGDVVWTMPWLIAVALIVSIGASLIATRRFLEA